MTVGAVVETNAVVSLLSMGGTFFAEFSILVCDAR